MNVLHIATEDIQGGAARAAYRLHQGLIKLGTDSQMLVKHKTSSDPSVFEILTDKSPPPPENEFYRAIQNQYINGNRTPISNTLFSLPYPGYDLAQSPEAKAADILNLHWIANFQSISTLQKLMALGKPLVWTLHDMWAFTGGCHYSSGCIQYQESCHSCPLLTSDSFGLVPSLLLDKLSLWETKNLTIVSPSRWLASCASQSRLFRESKVEVIPYSLDIETFKPLPKAISKSALGIDPSTITLLIGAQNGNERRKGFDELLTALKICIQDSRLASLIENNKLVLLCFGLPPDGLQSLSLPVITFGQIHSDDKLSQCYSASDLFILPSLEDNYPNTMLEAMCCSTPVIGFQVGGIPDFVVNGKTGLTVPLGDLKAMAGAIAEMVLAPDQRHQMNLNCRKVMEEGFSLTTQATKYLHLYHELLASPPRSNPLPSAKSTVSQITNNMTAQLDLSIGSAFADIFDDLKEASIPTELQQLRQQLVNTHNQFTQSQAEWQSQLAQLQSQLAQLQSQLAQSQSELAQSQSELAQMQSLLLQFQSNLSITEAELVKTQISLQAANARIEGMESSKFWKLREQIQKLKQLLGGQSK